ncbi:DUF3617 family protein [Pelomonas sp. APW6]|uniref:DUF3617 family protein n=1 Tax=Roseateles subflavus TaxID=3053353 RepID=A0ABT7LMQ3_9BURK|nr:DUF3617 family protein [Pelomonas sp. APW6]MDL5034148.1 DUF3617 family protein [Pelomonas sp. APW6]
MTHRPIAITHSLLSLGLILAFAQAQAAPQPEPGEWLVRTQETHEGNPKVLQALASLKALRNASAQGLPPGKAPAAASPNSVEEERDCITAEDVREMQPRQTLQQLVTGGAEGWKCQFTDPQNDQLQFSCRSPSGQTSKGQALMRFGARTFSYEISGTVEHKPGDASSRVTSKWAVDGRWLAAKCSAASLAQRDR